MLMVILSSSYLLLQGLRWAGLYRFWSFEQTRVKRDGGKQRDEVVVANLQCTFVRWEIFQVCEAGVAR